MLNIIVTDAKCSFNACIVSMLMSSFKLFNICKIIQIMAHNTTRQTQTQTYSQAHWISVLKVCHLHAILCCTSTMRREAMSHNRDYLCVFCSGFFETHPFPTIVLNSHAYELLSAWNRGETVQTAWHLIWVWKKTTNNNNNYYYLTSSCEWAFCIEYFWKYTLQAKRLNRKQFVY